MHNYEDFYKKFKAALAEEAIEGDPRELYDPIQYMIDLGGKRLRPVLLLLSCDAFGGNCEEAMPAALAIEMFHNFTLVHDDIMDGAEIRRGKETIWNIWGEDTAILVGDTMFTLAMEYLNRIEHPQRRAVTDTFLKASRQVCEGQQLDMNYEDEDNTTIPDYLAMIELKTAVLIASSLKIGALMANAGPEDVKHIYEFGLNIGKAFQLKDDLLDVFGNVDKFGKLPGGDILSDKKTFLLLKALSIANKKDKGVIEGYIGEGDDDPEQKVMDITAIYSKLNIDKITITEMERHYERAIFHLNLTSLEEENKAELIKLAKNMMYRES